MRLQIHFNHDLDQTKQSFKEEVNINNIMRRFQKSGTIDHYAKHAPSYGTTSQSTLQDAVNIIADAETMFEELPSSIRKKFNNEPGQFLDFVQNPKNLEEMRELGLANPQSSPDQIADSTPAKIKPAPASSAKSETKDDKGEGQET